MAQIGVSGDNLDLTKSGFFLKNKTREWESLSQTVVFSQRSTVCFNYYICIGHYNDILICADNLSYMYISEVTGKYKAT